MGVARIFRLVKTLKGLQILFQTLLIALPSVFNVGTILLLLHFIAAVMAMNVLAPIKLQENLNEHANFQGFGISMLTLFRVSTGESYNALMHDCRIGAPYCEKGTWIDADMNVRDSNCGQHTFSPFFFCLFFVASNYVLLNLLVAIIIDSLVMVANMNSGVVTPEDIEEFRTGWRDLDPDGDSLIPVDNVLDLIMQVRWPLGLRDSPGSRRMSTRALRKHAEKMMLQLNIRNYHGEVHFHDTIMALMDRAMGHVRFHADALHAKKKIENHVEKRALHIRKRHSIRRGKSMRNLTKVTPFEKDHTIADEFAVRKIQYAWRKYKSKKRRRLIFKS